MSRVPTASSHVGQVVFGQPPRASPPVAAAADHTAGVQESSAAYVMASTNEPALRTDHGPSPGFRAGPEQALGALLRHLLHLLLPENSSNLLDCGWNYVGRASFDDMHNRAIGYSPQALDIPSDARAESAIGVPAIAERPRPRSHSVAGRPALGWLQREGAGPLNHKPGGRADLQARHDGRPHI